MNWEKSCGAVVFTRRGKQLLFLIVQEQPGGYSFPKGHMEGDETELETVHREIFEETGLQPAFLDGFYQQDAYHLSERPGTRKQVTYFLAEFGNEPCSPRRERSGGSCSCPMRRRSPSSRMKTTGAS
nr:NUDIX domain-containing protein [Clostridia bacterium]